MASPETAARTGADDFGRALGTLLRSYLAGARELVDHVPGGPRGFQVLTIAASAGCRNQATIAELLGLDRTVMTYLVDDLERAGLVERRPDPADRRSRQVVLTDVGRATHDAAQARLGQVERRVLGALGEQDAEQFRSLLLRATSELPAESGATVCTADDQPGPC